VTSWLHLVQVVTKFYVCHRNGFVMRLQSHHIHLFSRM